MEEKTQNLLKRLDLIKDHDPFNKRLLNDCFNLLQEANQEIQRLQYHNNNLMNVIYQNQDTLETLHEPTRE
jgi:hypothetical protein